MAAQSLQRLSLKSSLDMATRNGKAQTAVLKGEAAVCGVHGTTFPLPPGLLFECCVFRDVCPSFGCETGQLHNCAVCQALREDHRESVGDHAV